jgi:hypothetical protein
MKIGVLTVVAFLLGWVLAQQVPVLYAQQSPPPLQVVAGWDIAVRPVGVADFASAKKFGVEVRLDEPRGNLIYMSETGSIAVVPAKK